MQKEQYRNEILKRPIEIEIEFDDINQEYIVSCRELGEYGEGMTILLAKRDLIESVVLEHDSLRVCQDNTLSNNMLKRKQLFMEIVNASKDM